ncbi:type VI secretion system baseplate subunit TssG [Massilia sp. CF038]|uniref:type VI secretion system baseplate subunit TssG n=1 Tax=Massilia sp. CF038 TaxID=1881045 RepID=UPI0009179521|nr:type VI secretion system baseplate subunit TssG [Massilia sp. CF038]SHH10079.1 type VI secretion system protein ImpH [Massilia sp. CF038]
MGAFDQLNTHTLPSHLREQADRYEFVQLVRLLERAVPGATEIGGGAEPAHEAVRFRAKVGFAFSTSDVLGAARLSALGGTQVEVAFMGLAGNEGPLPQPYSEMVLQRARPAGAHQLHRPAPGQADDDARDFLDIFNHRLLSYFYRGRRKHSIALGAESRHRTALLERILFQLIGYNEGVRQQGGSLPQPQVDPRCLLRYAGILARRNRAMAGLETMLSDAFGTGVRGSQHHGCWMPVDAAFQSVLGARGRNCVLGQQTMLGRRAWDARGKIVLTFGPLSMAAYQALMPGGADAPRLTFMTRFYLRDDVDVDIVLTLAPDAVREEALGVLSRTAWLGQHSGSARTTRFALGRWEDR